MKANCPSSGSCLGAMKLCLAIVVCLSAIGHQLTAEAAVCTALTNLTCVATAFTLATCDQTTFTCGCQLPNYVNIPTGCATKLATPTVQTERGRSTEFIPSTAAVKLTCSTVDAAFVTYEWRKGETVVAGATSQVYDVTGSDTEKAGSYRCASTFGAETSELSDAVVIKLMDKKGPASKPIVLQPPRSVAVGAKINLDCTNIPYGAISMFKINGNAVTSPVLHATDKLKKPFFCLIAGDYSGAESSPVLWTETDAADIVTANIKPTGPVIYKTGASVTFTCETDPPEQLMLVDTKKITYTFQDSEISVPAANGNTYTVTSTAGAPATHLVSCGASYDKKGEKKSGKSSLTFSNDYIKPPKLTANSVEVLLGSRLVLTCGDAATIPDTEFTWTKDGATIARQRDRIIQFGNFQVTDAGKYVCTAIKADFVTASNVTTITVKSLANSLHVLGSTLLLALVALASSKIL